MCLAGFTMALCHRSLPEYILHDFVFRDIILLVYWSINLGTFCSEERLVQAIEPANRSTLARICWSFSEAYTNLPLMNSDSVIGQTLKGHFMISLLIFSIIYSQKMSENLHFLNLFARILSTYMIGFGFWGC